MGVSGFLREACPVDKIGELEAGSTSCGRVDTARATLIQIDCSPARCTD